MALTLQAAIGADDTVFDVLGSDELVPGDFHTIDSETIVIRTANPATLAYGETSRYRVTAYRGAESTRKASHAAGATVAAFSGGGGGLSVTDGTTTVAATSLQMPAGTVTDLGSGVAGVGFLNLSLRTFDVSFDDVGFQDPNTGVLLWTPVDGEIIIDVWARIVTQFTGSTKAQLYIGGNNNFDQLLAGAPDLVAAGAPTTTNDFLNAPGSSSNETLVGSSSQFAIVPDGSSLSRSLHLLPTAPNPALSPDVIAAVMITGSALAGGSLRIYVLSATPAS